MKLEIDRVTKAFGGHLALDAASLDLDNVHTLSLIGPSGGGKSTLLRIIAGLEIPDSGSVSIDQARISFDEPSLIQHRRTVGTVFQAFNLFPHLTALENITLPLEKVHGYSKTDARARAMELLVRFRLETHAGKKPAQLSGGQRQRVAIVRAVSIKPQLLLFDEPTSALDPEMTAEVLDMILELRSEGRNFVIVTHEMGFARQAADFTTFLADGKILETAPSEELFSQPVTQAAKDFLHRILRF